MIRAISRLIRCNERNSQEDHIKCTRYIRHVFYQDRSQTIQTCFLHCFQQIVTKLVGSVCEDISDLLRKNPNGTEKLSITNHKRHIDMSDVESDPKRKTLPAEPSCSVTYSSTVTLDSVITCSSSTNPAALRLTKSDTDVFRNSPDESNPEPMRTSNTHVLLTFELSYDKKHDQILFGEGLGR